MHPIPKHLQKANGRSRSFQQWTLVDSAMTVHPIHMDYVVNWCTHRCWNPIFTVNGCDLRPPTRTHISEQEYKDSTAVAWRTWRRPGHPKSEITKI